MTYIQEDSNGIWLSGSKFKFQRFPRAQLKVLFAPKNRETHYKDVFIVAEKSCRKGHEKSSCTHYKFWRSKAFQKGDGVYASEVAAIILKKDGDADTAIAIGWEQSKYPVFWFARREAKCWNTFMRPIHAKCSGDVGRTNDDSLMIIFTEKNWDSSAWDSTHHYVFRIIEPHRNRLNSSKAKGWKWFPGLVNTTGARWKISWKCE